MPDKELRLPAALDGGLDSFRLSTIPRKYKNNGYPIFVIDIVVVSGYNNNIKHDLEIGMKRLESWDKPLKQPVSHWANLSKFCHDNGLRFHSEAFGKAGVCVDVWTNDGKKIGYRKSYQAALNMAKKHVETSGAAQKSNG